MAWAGCDVAKASFEAALWWPSPEGLPRPVGKLPVASFPRSRAGVEQFLAWAEGHLQAALGEETPSWRVVMEATGKYSTELAIWLTAARPSTAPAILNPRTAHAFTESLALRNKTDRTDARALALYGAERAPAAYEPPTPERARLRDLSRYRQALVQARVAEENRAAEGSTSPTVRQIQQRRIRQLQRDIARLETAMHRALDQLPDLQRDARQLDGLYGIGFLTAVTVLAELGDLRRFHKGRQLTAFSGLSPRHVASGTSVRKRSRLSKQGSSRVRAALYMPALAVIRGDNDLALLYHRLVAQGKKPKAALAVVMRKLLLLMRAVLISGQPYQPHFRPCGQLHTQKENPIKIYP